jgi:hypothetical protein
MAESDTSDVAAFFEQELGLPAGFFGRLVHEDDWSFIIKLHAFFESVVTELLVKCLGREKLRGVLAELPLSDKQIGKMVFARQLGLLEDQPRRFISDLSVLRNDLVHDVRNVQFELKEYVKRLDKNKRKNFRNNFGFAFEWLEQGSERREALMAENPKLIILSSAYECLILIYLKRQDARVQVLEAALARAMYEQTQVQSEGGS